ncbi:hypothetical protein PBI_SCTP2_327 [Salicola phage SCTP-2]|nr:hypothetical protein PBI_SCTP2_327 [Salicola phage SCTP-2]
MRQHPKSLSRIGTWEVNNEKASSNLVAVPGIEPVCPARALYHYLESNQHRPRIHPRYGHQPFTAYKYYMKILLPCQY